MNHTRKIVKDTRKNLKNHHKSDKKPLFRKKIIEKLIFFHKTFGDSKKSSTFALAKRKQHRLFFEILKK